MVAAQRDDDVDAILKSVDTMVRDGHARDAIGVATSANRTQRDARLERCLVHLRHTAFADQVPEHGRDSWPPEVPDLFPAAEGLVEIDARDLSAETLGSAILRHGCLLVRGLVSQPTLDRLRGAIDDTFAALDARGRGESNDRTTQWFTPFTPAPQYTLGHGRRWVTDGGGVWVADSPRSMYEVLEAFDEAGLARPLTEYLGERPALSVKKWTLRRVPTTSSTNWHQDGAFLGQGIRTVNVWLALSHCGDDAPGLDVVARRLHDLAPTGSEGAYFDWAVGEPVVERVAAGAPIVRPVFEAGDALLFDELFLHRTAVDASMTKSRYAIESWFFAPSRYPDEQVPLLF